MSSLFVAWQDPNTSEWRPVAKLDKKDQMFRFQYTKGANTSSFIAFDGMENINETYYSDELFPFFSNRILSKKRPEYSKFINWLNLESKEADPFDILGRSGGIRGTDAIQIFAAVEPTCNSTFEMHFFSHGIRHLDEFCVEKIKSLKTGESLKLLLDVQNDMDRDAIAIRTCDPTQIIGYCPRFLTKDLLRLLKEDAGNKNLKLSVAKVNNNAPIQYRLLCKLEAKWVFEEPMFASDLYQPLS